MLHTKRRWCVATIDNVDEIACGLTGNTQVLCTGIRWCGLLLLNDAANEDGAQEYAVIDERTGYQVESLTCSWMHPDRLKQALIAVADGPGRCVMVTHWNEDPRLRIETPDEHKQRTCAHCA